MPISFHKTILSLKSAYNELGWFFKLFFPSQLADELLSYPKPNSSDRGGLHLFKAFEKNTGFFQKWFFTSLSRFDTTSYTKALRSLNAAGILEGTEAQVHFDNAIFSCTAILLHPDKLQNEYSLWDKDQDQTISAAEFESTISSIMSEYKYKPTMAKESISAFVSSCILVNNLKKNNLKQRDDFKLAQEGLLTQITPGEALLFLSKCHVDVMKSKKYKENDALLFIFEGIKDQLETRYRKGVHSKFDATMLNETLSAHAEVLQGYGFVVDDRIKTRQKDGARRSYETLVAFESSKTFKIYKNQHDNLLKLLSNTPSTDIGLSNRDLVDELSIFSEQQLEKLLQTNEIIHEYHNYLTAKNDLLYEHTETKHREILVMLIKDFITLFVLGNRQIKNLPFDIYGKGMFQKDNRGRIFKDKDELKVCIGNGLVFSLFRPIQESPANRSKPFTAVGNDNVKPEEGAAFPNSVKESQTGIFINSISGTMLVVIRVLLGLHEQKRLIPGVYDDWASLAIHVAAMIDANLYIVGGHSYFEYFAVIEELKKHDFKEKQNLFMELIQSLAILPKMEHLKTSSVEVLFNCSYDFLDQNQRFLLLRRINQHFLNSTPNLKVKTARHHSSSTFFQPSQTPCQTTNQKALFHDSDPSPICPIPC